MRIRQLFSRRRHISPWRKVFLVFSVLIIATAIGAAAYTSVRANRHNLAVPAMKKEILSLWNTGNRQQTLEMARKACETMPLDPFFLGMRGIAAYYSSFDSTEDDGQRQSLLDEALISLRKSLAVKGSNPLKGQIDFVLAKTYFQKGQPWYDLAERYFNEAEKAGIHDPDLSSYMGIISTWKKDYAKAATFFERALQQNASDIVMMSAAVSYRELGNLEKATELLKKILENAADPKIRSRAMLMLGQEYLRQRSFRDAEGMFQKVIEQDPLNADAWYGLGLVYADNKDTLRARSAFRKAVQIDPNHIDARRKLAEKL